MDRLSGVCHIDFDSIDETFAYMRENPEAFWEELPGAAAQVLLDTIGDVIAIGKIDIPRGEDPGGKAAGHQTPRDPVATVTPIVTVETTANS